MALLNVLSVALLLLRWVALGAGNILALQVGDIVALLLAIHVLLAHLAGHVVAFMVGSRCTIFNLNGVADLTRNRAANLIV